MVPVVHSSLVEIFTKLNDTVHTVIPGVVGLLLPLEEGEIEAVFTILADAESIISEIEACLKGFVGSVKAGMLRYPVSYGILRADFSTTDVKALLAPEISAILALVLPFATPVAGFAHSVAGTVVGTATEGKLTYAAASLTSIAGGLLSPIGGVLSVV